MYDVLIIDGYVDEPALLGVPPYISPEPRLLAGAAEDLGLKWRYITIDNVRQGDIPSSSTVLVHGGVTVPGNYLGGRPMSLKEANRLSDLPGDTYIGGPMARYGMVEGFDHVVAKDLSAYFYDGVKGSYKDRWTTLKERDRWLKMGVSVVKEHPWFDRPLIAEMETYRGCVRYFTGGCGFCSEPDYGRPEFREVRDILDEISGLYGQGVRNFRLGGQSCILCYGAEDIGKTETPVPSPEKIGELFQGIWERCPDIRVLHVDNANPAVISQNPEEAREVIRLLVKYTTPGNVLALGMESADPEVIKKNDLNASPQQVRTAVELINELGKERGGNGMPYLLPGLNFIGGLPGETGDTYEMNFNFLRNILDDGLLLRRINIRQVLLDGRERRVENIEGYRSFKKKVRHDIDRPMLKKLVPTGTILRDVYMEVLKGNTTFGRQVGTYPILIGIKYPLTLDRSYNVIVTEHGYRSITAVHHPFVVQEAGFKQLEALPGIGKKRAAAIFRKCPQDLHELKEIVKDDDVVEDLEDIISF
ncbi:MAG: radical SAM protein [Thermoplasmata archaeon]